MWFPIFYSFGIEVAHGPAAAAPEVLLKCNLLGPIPDLLSQNLHPKKIQGDS